MDYHVVCRQVAFDQLERLDGNDWRARWLRWFVFGFGWRDHPGQAPAVGAYHGDGLARQLDQHAAQGVASAFQVGGENRPPDQLLKHARWYYMITGRGEIGNLRKETGILDGQGKLRVLAAHHQMV